MLCSRSLSRCHFMMRGIVSAADNQTPTSSNIDNPDVGLKLKIDSSEGTDLSSTALSRPVTHYLDTHSAVLELQEAGQSPEQAATLVRVLTQSLQEAVTPIERSVVSHQQLELTELRMMKGLEGVLNKLVLLEKTSLESLKKENDVLKDTVAKLMNSFKDEVTKVQSNLQLDLNLEKGRIKEEATGLLQEVKNTNNRIDMEVALIKTQMEAQKLEAIKYLAGIILSMFTVGLGVWRLTK